MLLTNGRIVARMYHRTVLSVALLLVCGAFVVADENRHVWLRHVIDDSSRGADGTRLADVNGDGLQDIVVGWEQGGVTRVYVNPGPEKSKQAWPSVTVGETKDVEDAVFVDLDSDGAIDVVSSCEGQRQVVHAHWAPQARGEYLSATKWNTVAVPSSVGRFRWMYAAPMDVNADGQMDLIAGGKSNGAQLGWFEIPADARDVSAWKWHPMRRMGWLMSLESVDMNGDGDQDILFTDRKGGHSGCYWLENPGRGGGDWREHLVGAPGREAMFLKRSDLDGDGLEDVLIAVRPNTLLLCQRLNADGKEWREHEVTLPKTYGGAKAIASADLNGDGKQELVFSTEGASDGKMGVGQFVLGGDQPFADTWDLLPISGVDGIKHDLVELVDLDGDGDLDVLTCEEKTNLGVIWYENPR